jgi:tetratricopeptide (TPR) repeat protein
LVVRLLSPAGAATWSRALASIGASTSWLSLSLDPGASLLEAVKWFCYGCAFIAGAVVSGAESRRVLPTVVFSSAVIAALVTLAHRLLEAESLFGLYTPSAHMSFAISPLINANNFAGYLNLGAFTGLGLMLAPKPVAPRWILGVGISVVVGLSMACGSRAGLASLAVGAVALVVSLWLMTFDGYRTRALIWAPLLVFLGGLSLFLLAAEDGLWRAMIAEGAKKLALISWTKPVVADYPIFGIGRGAFETVFPAYRADAGHHIYQFAENFVMQWCVEWGLPVGLATCAAFGYLLRPSRLGTGRDVIALCCSLGIGVLLLQNLLDLALEVMSVALALFALLGSLWARRREVRFETRSPRFLPGFVGVAGVLWATAAIAAFHPAFGDRQAIAELSHQASEGDLDAKSTVPIEISAAIARHPADPYFPLVAALVARGQPSELTFLAQAIDRDPMSGRPYLILAQTLAQHGANQQALHAVRLAVEREYALIGPGTKIAVSLTHQLDDLMHAVPEGSAGVGTLVYLAQQGSLRADRSQLLARAMMRDKSAAAPRLVRADDLLWAVESKAEQCTGANAPACAAELRELSQALARIDPKSDRPTVIAARLLLAEGNTAAANRLLAQKCGTFVAAAECVRLRFLVAETLNDPKGLEEAASALLGEACSNGTNCAGTATWLAERYRARGDWGAALHMYERAAHESESPQAWRNVANSANRLGLASVAMRALQRAGDGPRPEDTSLALTLERKRVEDLAASQGGGPQ